jgi:hypothetical protein
MHRFARRLGVTVARRHGGLFSCINIILAAGTITMPASPQDAVTFPKTMPHLDVVGLACPPTTEFIGFNLSRDGKPFVSTTPEFVVGFPTRLETQWVAGAEAPESLELVVSIKGSGPQVDIAMPVHATPWVAGCVTTAAADLEVPRFSHAGSGILSIGLRTGGHEAPVNVVYRGPSYTHPIVTTAAFPADTITQLYGAGAVSLRSSFRLGRGARVPVTCSRTPAQSCVAIGVVSALHHSFQFTQGEAIARITFLDNGNHELASVILRAGVDTSLSEYDVPIPGTIELARAFVASTRPHPGDRLTWNRKPLTLYTYAALLPLAAPAQPARLEVQYLSQKGVIDIYDLVLVYDANLRLDSAE